MAQLIMALGIVCALIYFLFFRTPAEDAAVQTPAAYQTEVKKAQDVEQVLEQSADDRRQQLEQQESGQ